MNQTKMVSAVEAFCNIGSGFILSLIVWQILAYLMGIPMPIMDNLLITSVFTVISLVRSYMWRRFFARGLHSKLVNYLRSNTNES